MKDLEFDDIDSRLSLLRAQVHFADLGENALQSLAGCARTTDWEAGSYLFRQGEPADSFYLIDAGRVVLELFAGPRGRMRIQTLESGELLGWSWLFAPFRWHFDALALTAGRGLVFDAPAVRQLCEHDHELGYQLQKRFSGMIVERLQATCLQLLDLHGGAAP